MVSYFYFYGSKFKRPFFNFSLISLEYNKSYSIAEYAKSFFQTEPTSKVCTDFFEAMGDSSHLNLLEVI
jgi:hypothetical protein